MRYPLGPRLPVTRASSDHFEQSRWIAQLEIPELDTPDGQSHRRKHYAFRYNLFWHVGERSSVGNSGARYRPSCYQLLADWLPETEIFHARECSHDDIWPCLPAPAPGSQAEQDLMNNPPFTRTLIDWDSPADQLCPHHYGICYNNERHIGCRPLCSPGVSEIAGNCRINPVSQPHVMLNNG